MALIADDRLNHLTGLIINAAMEVHRQLGPGLLESVYQICLIYELRSRGLKVDRDRRLPVRYKGMVLESALKLDLLVNDTVVVEVKSIDAAAAVHKAQVLTYLKLAAFPVGLLINFNVPVLKDGMKRILNTGQECRRSRTAE
jgi:GxxExxY protein